MKLKDIINATNVLLDENFPQTEIIQWVNDALNDLGVAVGATFPEMTVSDTESSPVIPSKYHRLLVLYAAAKGKEKDSAVGEAQNFMAQYERGKVDFISNYVVPNQYDDNAATASVTNEPMIGAVDGVNRTFVTRNKLLVKDSLTVLVGGLAAEVESVDWDYGVVVLKDAPAPGNTPTASYRYYATTDFVGANQASTYPNPFGWSW